MMPVMALLASRLGLDGMAAGWAIVLGLSAVVGMALAAGLGRRMRDAGTVSSVAFFVGLGLWLVEAAMVPLLFGEPPSAIVTNPSMWPAAMMLLVATLLFTSIVAGVLLAFRGRPRATTTVETEDLRRAA
jgi:drug/metabolite transporter (DMT)-like permease